MWETRTKFPLKNVGDSHIIPGKNVGEASGAHSGACLDFRSDAFWRPLWFPFGVHFPLERTVRPGQYPPAPLSALFSGGVVVRMFRYKC